MSGTQPPPGYAHAPPAALHPGPYPGANNSPGKAMAIRVAWSLAPILTLGFLAWVPTLVLALHRRTRQAWAIFVGSAVLPVTVLVLLAINGSESTKAEIDRGEGAEVEGVASVPGNIGGGLLVALWVAAPIYWFITTRRGSRARIRGMPVQPHPMTGPAMPPIAAYGWQQTPTAPAAPQAVPPPAPPHVPPAPVVPGPGVPHRQDARVERARARLEGLSERLREREGGAGPDAPR